MSEDDLWLMDAACTVLKQFEAKLDEQAVEDILLAKMTEAARSLIRMIARAAEEY